MKISAEKPEERRGVTRRTALGGGLALTLAGCNSMGVQLQGIDVGKTAGSVPPPAGAPLAGETLGSGPVRVGMILPLTQNGAPSPVGVSMRNAAQLAIDDFGGPLHHLDDPGRPLVVRTAPPKPPNRSSAQGLNSSSGRCSPTTCARRRRRQNRLDGR